MADTGSFFMVYGMCQEPPRIRHETYERAKAEATRLASLNPGIEFFILMPVGVAKRTEPIEFRELANLDAIIPF
jgi:hypothetical protein